MSRVGVRETIRRYSESIGLTKYWSEEVVTAWNMTHPVWLDLSDEVTVNTSKRLEHFCDFIKANEQLSLKAIAEKYCMEYSVPFITEDKKKVYLRPVDDFDTQAKLAKAKDIITKLVEGIKIISDPKVYMTDVDAFVSEAEQFLKEV